jgi:hypothetical protein
MYTMVGSRPDLVYPLSVLGRYTASSDTYHMALAKRVLAYVKAIINYRLHYSKDWVDSDYVNSDDRKSTTGLYFFVENALVYWCSKRQVTIATSTTVAKYFTLYKATTECVYLRNLMADIGLSQTGPTLIREDNQTTIKLAEDETFHKRTKHITVKYHYSKEQQDLGITSIFYVSTEDNIADFFTKPQNRVQYQQMCK